MKKEIISNLLKLKKLSIELGLPVKKIGILPFYLENNIEVLPKKFLGIEIENGGQEEIIIKGQKLK